MRYSNEGFYEECHGVPTWIDMSDETAEDASEYIGADESYVDMDDCEEEGDEENETR